MAGGPESSRAAIPPRTAGEPRWSVMIPAHDCSAYLAEALRSVLAQDPGPDAMQIEVVDDASSDDVEAVVRTIGEGRVEFFRQPRNVGHVANFTTCLERARGELVHLLHCDDRVLPGFYRAMERAFREHSEIGAGFCRVRRVLARPDGSTWTRDDDPELPVPGIVPDWLLRIAAGQRVETPAVVVRRAVYERLGSFDARLLYAEDWEMWARIAAAYPVWHEPEVLAVYRIHPQSSTGRLGRTAETVRDLRRAAAMIRRYVPADQRDMVAARQRRFITGVALAGARRSFDADAPGAALRHLVEAWRTAPSLDTLRDAAPAVRDGARWLRRAALRRRRHPGTPAT